MSLHGTSAASACQLYRDDFSSESTLSFTRVTTSAYHTGRFEVVERLGSGERQAQVRVIRSTGGVKAASYFAAGGYLQVDELPADLPDWQRGGRVRGHLRAEFPEDPLSSSTCDSVGSKDGATVSRSCTCLTASGAATRCEPTTDSSCCATTAPATLVYEADIDAEPCSYVCAYTDPSLAGYCLELQ